MPEAKFHTATVVLGMHRSGTSALTGLLGQCGLDLPSKLIAPSETNERGFLESPTVTALNDEILRHHGVNWHTLGGIDTSWTQGAPFRAFVGKARDLIADEYTEARNPLIKDPRICRLVDVWTAAFSGLSERAVFPIIIRNPLEVSNSLNSRNGFEIELGLLLWARYYLDAERLTRGQPRCFLRYSVLLEDWTGTLKRLERTLALPLSPQKIEAVGANAFISADLQHHKATEAQIFSNLAHAPLLLDAYRTLSGWADGAPETAQDHDLLDNALSALNQMSGLLSEAFERARLDRKRMSAVKDKADVTVDSLDRANEALRNLAAERENASVAQEALKLIADKQEVLASQVSAIAITHDRNYETLTREQSTSQLALDALTDWRIEQRHTLEETNRILASLVTAMQSQKLLERCLAQSEDERATLQKQVDEISGVVEELRKDIISDQHENKVRAEEQEEQLRLLQGKLEEAHKELKSVKRKYRATQLQLQQSQNREGAIKEQLLETRTDLAYYRQPLTHRTWRTVREAGRHFSQRVFSSHAGAEKRKFEHWRTVIGNSALFDEQWYLAQYPDVAEANIAPALHYARFGWREGRDPGPKFNTDAYLEQNADVAAAAINPLVHFVEYGETEGREVKAYAAPPKPLARMDFRPAAPCPQFPVEAEVPLNWRRHYRLDAQREGTVLFGEVIVGHIGSDGLSFDAINAVKRFQHLSPHILDRALTSVSPAPPSAPKIILIDAWFARSNLFRLRCGMIERAGPFVVRVFQYSLEKMGPLFAGEGIFRSTLDFVECHLHNHYAPIILFATDPDGLLLDVRLLAFPSLCRGGRHHNELVTLSPQDSLDRPLDIFGIADHLANQLAQIETGREKALLDRIVVNVSGADGSEPLFQPEIKAWLDKIARITVDADPSDGRAEDAPFHYLCEAIAVTTHGSPRDGQTALHLAGNMLPTISALCAARTEAAADGAPALLSMIAERKYAGENSLIVTAPAHDEPQCLAAPDYAAVFPKMTGTALTANANGTLPVAIRIAANTRLTSAELLCPVAPPALHFDHNGIGPAITLLIPSATSNEAHLFQSLKALALQENVGDLYVAYIGEPTPSIALLTGQLFGRRWYYKPNVEAALQAVETAFVGYLGPDIILHDTRTLSVLHALSMQKGAQSASCVIVECQERGKSWLVTPVDAGDIAYAETARALFVDALGTASHIMWRAIYPVISPPKDLWLTHSDLARKWLDTANDDIAAGSRHFSTSYITASYISKRTSFLPPIAVPRMPENQSLLLKKIA